MRIWRGHRSRRIVLGAALPGLLLIGSTQFVLPPAGASSSGGTGSISQLHQAVTSNGVPAAITSLGDGGAPLPGRDFVVYVRATSPASVPGGAAGFFVTVSNTGKEATAPGSPTTITLAIPSGMTFGSVTDLSGTSLAGVPSVPSGEVGATWQCAVPVSQSGSETVSCEFGTRAPDGTVVASAIAGQSAAAAFVVLQVNRNFATDSAGVVRTLKVSLAVAGNSATTDLSSSANELVITGAPSPGFFPDVSGSASVGAGQTATESIQVLNVGSGAATSTASQPTVELSNLLPSAILGDWKLTSSGWTCNGAPNASPTCTYDGGSLGVGAITSPLTLEYRTDPIAIGKLGLSPGAKPSIESWKIGITGAGIGRIAQSYENQIAVVPTEGSNLILEAAAAGGIDQLVPGASTAIDVKISNVGAVATKGVIAVSGSLPAGVTLKGAGSGAQLVSDSATAGSEVPWTCKIITNVFSCSPIGELQIPRGGSSNLVLNVEATPTAKAGALVLNLEVISENATSGVSPAATTVRLFILTDNVGFPVVSLSSATGRATLVPVTDGAPTDMLVGATMVERLDVTNAGGAAIAPKKTVDLSQHFTDGVVVRSVTAPNGEQCTVVRSFAPSITCIVDLVEGLGVRATLVGPRVVLLVNRPTIGISNWAATARLSGTGAPPLTSTGDYVSIGRRVADLVASLSSTQLPSAGGFGRWNLLVSNRGNQRTPSHVSVLISLPRGAGVASAGAKGWSCAGATASTSGQASIRCSSNSLLGASSTLNPIRVRAKVPAKDSSRTYTVSALASSGGSGARISAKDSMTVVVRNAIHALIKAPDTVVFDDVPLTSLSQQIRHSTVTLEGDGSGGNGLGLSYRWTQRCTTQADVASLPGRCKSLTPKVKWVNEPKGTTNPTTADVLFVTPSVASLTPLVFQLTVSDGSSSANAFQRISVIPPTLASKGFAIESPHPPKPKSVGPASERLKLPSADAQVKVVSKSVNGSNASTLSTSLRSGRPVAARLTSVARLGSAYGRSAVSPRSLSVSRDTAALPALFCSLITDAAAGASLSKTFSGIELNLSNISITGTGCAVDTKVSFSNSSIKIGSLFSATGVAGTIGSDGIHLSSGTISGPSDWHAPSFSLNPDPNASGIVFGYTATDGLSVSGSVAASGFAFIPLPGQWTSDTKLDFVANANAFSISLSANATGPASDASPNSPKPTASLTGTVSSDGTFSITASATNFVQLQGTAINLSGSITRAVVDGPIVTSITGSLASPLKIVGGLSLDSLLVTINPTAMSLGLTGSGVVSVTSGTTNFGFAVSFGYSDPKNWSLKATGTGTSTWTPLAGLTISPSDASGSISAVNGAYEFSLVLSPQAPWTPKTGITLTNIVLLLSNVCPDSGAPCPTDASLFLKVSADASLNLPAVGTAQAHVAGVLALPTGAFSIEASLTNSLSLGAGISIDQAKIELNRGLAVPTGTATPLIDTQDPAGLSVSVQGSVTIPKIGSLPTVIASWSSAGWVVAANLGSYTLPGVGGGGTTLSDTVIGWSSFATSLNVVDPVTKIATSIPLPADAFEISGSYAAPDWFKQLFSLSSDAKGRATGLLNLSTGEFALKMSLAASPNWYLYGSNTTATSIRLDSVYFNIEHKGPDFSVSLGGTAAMVAPGVTAADPLKLGIAVSYFAASTTIAGSFTLTSKSGWQNAFGVGGLTLSDLALSFQLNIATLTPAIGFGATAILPSSIRDPLGMPSNVKTTLVANISLANPCFGIQIDDPSNSGANVLSIGAGALTAKQFQIEVAPSGCTVGQFHYDPGVSVNFDGAILGVSVAVKATISTSPFKLDASLNVGDFKVAGVVVDHTSIVVAVSSSNLAISFAGGIHVLGASISVTGGYQRTGTNSTIDLHGSLDNLVLGSSLNIKKVTVDMHVVLGANPSVQFAASGSVDLLGSSVDAAFKLNVDNGQLVEVTAAIKANITVGGTNGVNLNGTFNLDYGPAIPLVINADVAVSVGGFQFAHATAVINSSGFSLTTDINVNNVFTARLIGTLYYGPPPAGTTITGPNNTRVAATTGDFLFSAKDVSISLAGFRANGSVSIGRAGGTTWGAIGTRIQLLGAASGNAIEVNGSFSGNGDFSLSGNGTLSLVGFSVAVKASITKTGPNVTVGASGSLVALGSTVAVSGSFSSNNGSPLFRLNGSANLNLGGYSLGSGSFFISNYPQDAGLNVTINSRIGSVLNIAGQLSITGTDRFYLNVNANLDLKVLSTSASVVFTNCQMTYTTTYQTIKILFFTIRVPTLTNPVCSSTKATTLDATASIDRAGFSFGVSVHIDGNGNFSATASSPASGTVNRETGSVNFGFAQFYAAYAYRMSLTISSSSPYVSVSGYGSGDVYGKTWDIGFWYAGWGSWQQIVGITASIDTSPFRVCGSARVWGISFGPACIS